MNFHQGVLAALLATCAVGAHAEISGGVVKVGVLTDLSSVWADYAGESSILAFKMAIEDAGGSVNGKRIELVTADFQNKADVALAIARKWIDEEGVDVIVDTPNSGVAAAMSALVKEKNKVYLPAAVSSDLTGKFCTPNQVVFVGDSYSFAAVAASALVAQGLKSWYSVTADYAMGQAMERDTFAVVKAGNGKAVGSVRTPFGGSDMSSFVLQAQASKAQVLSVASGGADAQNILRAVNEYGVNKTMKVVSLNTELLDAYKLGKKVLGGTYITESWYWDQNDETRAFAKRFHESHPKKFYPSRASASHYGALTEYLKAVKALNDDTDGRIIVAKMKATPVNNLYARGAWIREDGRLIKDMYLAQIKTESEPKKNEWDLYKIVATVPGEKAFRPAAESECPLLKK